jgi:hypothetical protein
LKRRLRTIVFLLGLSLLFGCQNRSLHLYEKNGLWGYKDANGQVVIEPRFVFAKPFNQYGLALVADSKDMAWVYIDRKGRRIIKPYYIENNNDCDHFSEGLSRYGTNGRIGFFDERGKIRIKARYEFASPFVNGYAAVARNVRFEKMGELTLARSNQWGFIDRKGRLVIPYQYEAILAPFNRQGIAIVRQKGDRYAINKQGRRVTKN